MLAKNWPLDTLTMRKNRADVAMAITGGASSKSRLSPPATISKRLDDTVKKYKKLDPTVVICFSVETRKYTTQCVAWCRILSKSVLCKSHAIQKWK